MASWMSKPSESQCLRDENQPAVQRADSVPSHRDQVTIASWEGPLPPPNQLRRYEEIVPGAAERILSMTEFQARHRIQMERTVILGDSKRSYLGLGAAFILSALVIIGGIYVIVAGYPWAGATLVGINIVGLAGVFIYGTNSRRAEREQKDESMPQIRR